MRGHREGSSALGLQGASFLALLAALSQEGWFEGTSSPLRPKGLSVNASYELPIPALVHIQPC